MFKRKRIALIVAGMLALTGSGYAASLAGSPTQLTFTYTTPNVTIPGQTYVQTVTVPTVTETTTVTIPQSGSTTTAPTSTTPPPQGKQFGIAVPGEHLTQSVSLADQQREFADMAAAGATWVRFDLLWTLVQPTAGSSYNWAKYDASVDAARAAGLNVLLILDGTPGWACPSGFTGTCNWMAPADPSKFATFSHDAASHFGAKGVHAYELWNEPNLTNAYSGTQAQYLAMAKAVYPAVHAGDSGATVLVGGFGWGCSCTVGSPADWMRYIYANGGKGTFDAASVHPYPGGEDSNGTGPNNAWYQMKLMRDVMVANGDSNLKVWGTEYAYTTIGLTEADIQARIKTDFANWKSYSWSGNLFWFLDVDYQNSNYGLSGASYNPISHRARWDTFKQAVGG